MDARPFEDAYAKFLTLDVDVADYLSLELASVDGDFAELQQQSLTGTDAEKSAACDGLVRFAEEIQSVRVWDGVLASAFDRVKRTTDALEARRRALLLLPAWHPQEAPRVIGNVGWGFQELGQLDDARRFFERALAWDPENPYVLGSLAEVLLDTGDTTRALFLREHLAALGTPLDHTKDLDAKLSARGLGPSGAPPSGGLGTGGLRALDVTGFHRFTTTCQFDNNASALDKARTHVLACLMANRLAHALFAADLAAKEADRASLDDVWTRAVVALAARAPGAAEARQLVASRAGDVFHASFEARAEATVALAQRGDALALDAMLCDPHPFVRLRAARALTLDLGREEAVPFVETAARYEVRKAIDAARSEQVGLSASSILRPWRRRKLGPQPLSVIPEEGVDHPVFDRLEKGEAASLMLSFREALTPAQAQQLGAALTAAEQAIDWNAAGGKGVVQYETSPDVLHLVLVKQSKLFGTKPSFPREPLRAWLGAAIASGLPLREAMLARMQVREDASNWQSVSDPRSAYDRHYDGEEEFFRASLDPRAAPPAPEPEGGLFIMIPNGEGWVQERRNMPVFLAGARVCYGLLDDVDDRPRDARTDEVRDAIRRAMHVAYRGEPPRFFDKQGRDDELDPIAHDGRPGYAFALAGQVGEFLAHYPTSSRYREYELFVALRAACQETGLLPVIQWSRHGGTWIVNVWGHAPP